MGRAAGSTRPGRVIIFAGIVANLPSAIVNLLELGRTGALSTTIILLVIKGGDLGTARQADAGRTTREVDIDNPLVGADHAAVLLNLSGQRVGQGDRVDLRLIWQLDGGVQRRDLEVGPQDVLGHGEPVRAEPGHAVGGGTKANV